MKQTFVREDDVEKRLHTAINNQDYSVIDYFAQFGEDVRKQIRNAAAYEQYLLCGYTGAPRFDQYGWLANGSVIDFEKQYEAIHVYDHSQNWYARVYLLHHPNGAWVYGLAYFFGIGGGFNRPHTYSSWYDTRKEALTIALDTLQSQLTSIADKKKESAKVAEAIQRARHELFIPQPIQLTLDL